ncbi:MAG: hypothetical protein IH592_04520 [Bacteroidales bacterium]|nr:hypothetical protein [Bacteroidales bacterium]
MSFIKEKNRFLALLAGLMFLTINVLGKEYQEVELKSGWKVKMIEPVALLSEQILSDARSSSGEGWISADKMPAMISDILLQKGMIENIWLPGKAAEYRWIAEKDWIYTVNFSIRERSGDIFLLFKGLDGIADIYLNGNMIASHSVMYNQLKLEASGMLLNNNNITVHFHTVFNDVNGTKEAIKFAGGDKTRPVRRPEQNYINYLGPDPYYSRVGIFDKVIVQVTGGSYMSEVIAGSSLSDELDNGELTIDVRGKTDSGKPALKVALYNPDGTVAASSVKPLKPSDGSFSESIKLNIANPELWWPRGYGSQPLYRAVITLMINGRAYQTAEKTIGFRKVTMSRLLHFVVNGKPVRLWGGCWVTPDWQTEVWDQARAEELFRMAENANLNALRVWGVVNSPRDDFYELADRLGFMIWQDFTALPLSSDQVSIETCKTESEAMIKRLKHHPSVFIWCGGNENAMWHSQEFNNELEDRGPWRGVAATDEINKICQRLDPERDFMPSTPYFGKDPNDPKEGNTHGYTNLWFVPGYDFLNFASEDTRIATPVLHSLKKFMAPEDIWPDRYSPLYSYGNIYPWPETWLKYTTSTSWKKTGPVEQFYDASDAASLVYRIGMAEDVYYRDVIERQRRGRSATDPGNDRFCGGYLVWKFNDSWPQIYSAKVDYFLEPLHAYYTLKRAYQPVMLSFDLDAFYYLWVVNDSPVEVSGTVKIRLFHLDRNEVRKEITRDITIPAGESKVVVRLDEAGIVTFRREHILDATLTDADGNIIARTNSYGNIERNIVFPDARLLVEVNGDALVITSDKFARAVTLTGNDNGDQSGWFFEDNYFDLMPGEIKTVRILGRNKKGTITVKPWYSPHETTITYKR